MLEMCEDESEYCTAIVNGTASTFGLQRKMGLFYIVVKDYYKITLFFSMAWS